MLLLLLLRWLLDAKEEGEAEDEDEDKAKASVEDDPVGAMVVVRKYITSRSVYYCECCLVTLFYLFFVQIF